MSITSSIQTTYGIGSYMSPVNSIRKLNEQESPFAPTLDRERNSQSQENEQNKYASTDITGIVVSPETQAFLANLSEEEKTKVVNLDDELTQESDTLDAESEASSSTSATTTTETPSSTATTAAESSIAQRLSQEQSEYTSQYLQKGIEDLEQQKEVLENRTEQEQEGELAEGELTQEEEQLVKEMQARDAEVKAHEQAHVAAGAGRTGSISYTYQTGPDNKQYAVGGSVPINTSVDSSNPAEMLAAAQQIKAAALAPSDPSSADLSVAAAAQQIQAEAMKLQSEKTQEQMTKSSEEVTTSYQNEEIEQEVVQEVSQKEILNAQAEQQLLRVEQETPSQANQGTQVSTANESLASGTDNKAMPIISAVGLYAQNTKSLETSIKADFANATVASTAQLNKNALYTQIQTASAITANENASNTSFSRDEQYKSFVANTYQTSQKLQHVTMH